MHGSILNLLKRFVQLNYDHSTWLRLVEQSGLSSADFEMSGVYPDEHVFALVGEAAEMTGIPAGRLQEKFGEFLVPDLMLVYSRYVQPGWTTLQMIEHTEEAMHGAVRRDAPGTTPPVLHVTRLGADELEVRYASSRRMGALAVGIIRGLAVYFDEAEHIEVEPLTPEDGEEVIIRVRQV